MPDLSTIMPNLGPSSNPEALSISSPSMAQNLIQMSIINLTPAMLTAAFTTPQVLLPAVAGFSYVVDYGMLRFIYNSVAYTGGGVSTIGYQGGAAVLNTLAAGLFTGTANVDTVLTTGAANITATKGAAITLSTATANFAAGNTTAQLYLWYSLQ